MAVSNKDLLTVIRSYEDNVSDHMDSDAAQTRADLIDYYLGERYGNERDGYSKIVTREVYQTVENIKADVAELFIADDETVRFEPEGPEDIDAAQQATDYIRYVFYRQNDGFSVILDSLMDGLLQRQGVIKRWRHMEDMVTNHEFEEISEQAFHTADHQDIGFAEIQRYFNVYAFDDPMFYQTSSNGTNQPLSSYPTQELIQPNIPFWKPTSVY